MLQVEPQSAAPIRPPTSPKPVTLPVALQFVAVKTPLSSTCPINPPTLSPVEDTLALEEQLLTVVVP